MEPYYLDSNVFFYAKILDKKYGKACSEILKLVVEGKLVSVTSTLVVIELSSALGKFGLSTEIANEVSAIYSLGIPVHELLNSDVRLAAALVQTSRISPYDCAHVAVMKRNNIRLILSADSDFDKIHGVERVDPLKLHSS